VHESSAWGERRAAKRRATRRRRIGATVVLAAVVAGGAFAVVELTGSADGAASRAAGPAPPEVPDARAATAPAPVAPAQTRTPAPANATVSIAAVGDTVMGSVGDLPPDGGRTFFDGVDQVLRGDVVLGNLEGTLSTGGESKCGSGSPNCYAFQTPPSYARWLARAGFTVLNLANNHAFDYGQTGLRQTIRALNRHRLKHTGRPGQITYVDAGPVRISLIGFASYPWAQSLVDIRAARRIVRRAAGQADLVVVTFHGGAEGSDKTHVPRGTEWFLGENRGNLRAFSHAVVDAGADLVVGHGPHVLRGMEFYKGRLIAYSLGNFAGYGVFSLGGPLGISGVLRVTLKADGSWVSGRLVATHMVGKGIPVLDPSESAHGLVRTLSREDFGRRAARVTPVGRLLPPG
jgi:poly-gamma-glutamate capsule biosynthesis protein CapA/YwtB (metallophosphatase superfamily)